jgi:hypothetical protein
VAHRRIKVRHGAVAGDEKIPIFKFLLQLLLPLFFLLLLLLVLLISIIPT